MRCTNSQGGRHLVYVWVNRIDRRARVAGPSLPLCPFAPAFSPPSIQNHPKHPQFPIIVFSTILDYISRPYPDYVPDRFPDCSRLIFRLCSRPISRPVPDPFHNPVPPRNHGLPSRSVSQMASHLPVPFPSRRKQMGAFSHTVDREDPKKSPSAAG